MAARLRGRGGEQGARVVSSDDAYIYMLVISLVALVVGCVFLFLDYSSFPSPKPALPSVKPFERQPPGAPGG